LEGLTRVGPVVIVTGPTARICLEALLIAARSRRLSGLPIAAAYQDVAAELQAALSATGQLDVPEPVAAQPVCMPTVPVLQAAARMNRSPRQIRRLAPKLGGRLIGGRWLLVDQAINEHMEGGRP
jgi:hypothetical protein